MSAASASEKVHVVSRRQFLKSAVVASTAAAVAGADVSLAADARGLIDVNVSIGNWPARRLPLAEPSSLTAKLRAHGVTQAWTGSLDALLHKDLAAVNARLAEDCRRYGAGRLLPFGSINPKLPQWEEDLRRCVEVHRFRGIRLHPNYHGYRLDEPVFEQTLKLLAERNLIVQLALLMEDERMMHPLLRVPPVDTTPLAEVVRSTPGLRLVVLNALGALRGTALRNVISAGNVFFEISTLEGVGGVANLLEQAPAERILFGSDAPFFYFEAAELKLKESLLAPKDERAIRFENAARLFHGA